MTPRDTFAFALRAAAGNRLRSALMMLAMAIGVASVVVLTALGDGARRYVVDEFAALGANLLIVLPGRSETGGLGLGTLVTSTPRDLTVDDSEALRRLPAVIRIAPLSVGTSEIAWGGRRRDVTVMGTTADYLALRGFRMAQGRFLPQGDARSAGAVAVLGASLRDEMFGAESAIGRTVRVGDRRLRVVGVMERAGSGLGMATDELLIVPVATALAMFDTNTLFRILVEARSRDALAGTRDAIESLLAQRRGELDVTVITQDAVLGTFDRILATLTLAVAGIAAISLAVAGVLVMNVMLVAVTQRTAEIGLLKALGATARSIRTAFLVEAALLSVSGALAGLALGHAGAWGVRAAFPALPAWPPDWAVAAGLGTALVTGVLFGVLPARRAAQLDPIRALAGR